MLDLGHIRNPGIDLSPKESGRDPALVFHDGRLLCFHTVASPSVDAYQLSVCVSQTSDFRKWETQAVVSACPLNYSSPGNVLRVGDEWIMCIQSYPIDPGKRWGNEDSRLWLLRSHDLVSWTRPELIVPDGCAGSWSTSKRQIDPYLVTRGKEYWCFYKTAGQLDVLVSEDLSTWREAFPERPVLSSRDTPDGASLENPCVVATEEDFVMFFSPCRRGRGIGVAHSTDLLHWLDVRYLDFPDLPWADAGPTAVMVLDMRSQIGVWLMAFHGERRDAINAHSAAIGFAWSYDLEKWAVP